MGPDDDVLPVPVPALVAAGTLVVNKAARAWRLSGKILPGLPSVLR